MLRQMQRDHITDVYEILQVLVLLLALAVDVDVPLRLIVHTPPQLRVVDLLHIFARGSLVLSQVVVTLPKVLRVQLRISIENLLIC